MITHDPAKEMIDVGVSVLRMDPNSRGTFRIYLKVEGGDFDAACNAAGVKGQRLHLSESCVVQQCSQLVVGTVHRAREAAHKTRQIFEESGCTVVGETIRLVVSFSYETMAGHFVSHIRLGQVSPRDLGDVCDLIAKRVTNAKIGSYWKDAWCFVTITTKGLARGVHIDCVNRVVEVIALECDSVVESVTVELVLIDSGQCLQ